MSQQKTANPITIRLPAGGLTPEETDTQWAKYQKVLHPILPAHAVRGHSWCLETPPATPAARVARSLEGRHWKCFYAALRSKDVGFRPVIGLPEGHGMEDGTVFHRYTLTMDGHIAYIGLRQPHATRHYRPGAALRFTDHYKDPRVLIPWVVCGDTAVAAENLLVNISWNDLASQGFAL